MNYVYFARCEGYVKIGRSVNVERRIANLQTTMPFDIGPVWVIADPLRDLERECHHQFAAHRHRGEWFRWCTAIEIFIANRAGKTDDEIVEQFRQKTPETQLQRAVRETKMRIRGFTTDEIVSSRRLFRVQKTQHLGPAVTRVSDITQAEEPR